MKYISTAGNSSTYEERKPLRKFLFLFNVSRYNASCCFQIFTLRIGVILLAITDILLGIGSIILLLMEETYVGKIHFIWNFIIILPSVYGFISIYKSIESGVAMYYYCYVIKFFIKILLYIAGFIEYIAIASSSNFSGFSIFSSLLFLFIFTFAESYFSFIIFSAANLLITGEAILVNNGIEVVKMMNTNIKQAKALSVDPEKAPQTPKEDLDSEQK